MKPNSVTTERVIAVKKREYEFDIDKELEQLTCPEDSIEETAEEFPMLDDKAKERILKLCERKMNTDMKENNIKKTDYDTVSGVEKYNRPKWHRPVTAAASLLVAAGIGGAVLLNLNGSPDDTFTDADDSTIGTHPTDTAEGMLSNLVEKNFYCLENIYYFGNLPYKSSPFSDSAYFIVNSKKFPDYKTLKDYFYSVYSDDIADLYMTAYPSGTGGYGDIDGKLVIYPDIVFDGAQYSVDFTDFSLENVTESSGTYSFNVLADIVVSYKSENKEILLEDALIGFEAKTEDDGVRLTGMYGHDTLTRFIYNNSAEGSRGYIDTPWQETYLDLISGMDTVYTPDGKEYDNTSMYIRLFYTEGNDIPMLSFNDGVTKNTVMIYNIADGNTYIVGETITCEVVHTEIYSYSDMVQYLENAVYGESTQTTEASAESATETHTEPTTAETTEAEEATDAFSVKDMSQMTMLFDENLKCLGYFRNELLPMEDEPFYTAENMTLHEIVSDEFAGYDEFRDYVYSVYTDETADMYLNSFPYEGNSLYMEYEGKFCVNTSAVGNRGYFVDWSDYSFEYVSSDSSECIFKVTAAIQEPGDLPPEDYTLTCRAVMEDDGWRLEEMYY